MTDHEPGETCGHFDCERLKEALRMKSSIEDVSILQVEPLACSDARAMGGKRRGGVVRSSARGPKTTRLARADGCSC